MSETRRHVLHAGAAGTLGLLAAPFMAPREAQAESARKTGLPSLSMAIWWAFRRQNFSSTALSVVVIQQAL